MSYGTQVFSADGSLLVSEQGRCLHYIGQATYVGTFTLGTGGGTGYIYEINSAAGSPLPFLRRVPGSAETSGVKRVYLHSGTVYRIEVLASANGSTQGVFCFGGLASTAPAESYGHQVFSSTGICLFDSTRKPLALDYSVTLPANMATYSQAAAWATADRGVEAFTSASWPSGDLAFAMRGVGILKQRRAGPGFSRYYSPLISIGSSGARRAEGPLTNAPATSDPVDTIDMVLKEDLLLVVNLSRYL
jgi:hypothetical protein